MDVRAIRTIDAAHLSTHKTIGKPYIPLANSTLNQKFNVFPDELPMKGEYPYVAYLAIGRRGAKLAASTMGDPIPSQIPHSPSHAALYEHIPFIVRKLNEDIPASMRKHYRMRVPFTGKDGNAYVAYYLLAIDMTKVNPVAELRHVEDGKVTSTVFEHEVSDLSPKHIQLDNLNKNDPNADCLVSTAKLEIRLNANDIAEIINAFTVIDGDATGAVISEIALVSGVDRTMQANISGVTGSYIECICAQVNSFIHKYTILDTTSTALDMVFDVGSSELMIL